MQTKTSGREVGRANRAAMNWWTAEDELVGEQRPWKRWRTRRVLRSWRDQETAEAIQHVQQVLLSWVVLLLASLIAFGAGVVDLIRSPSWL